MRTFLTFSGGRVEMRARFSLECLECGESYHPRVHAYPERTIALALVTILVLLGLLGLWLAGRVERSWLLWAKVGAAVAIAVIGLQASRLQKRMLEPKFYSRGAAREPEFGEIVLDCPRCGSARARLDPQQPG